METLGGQIEAERAGWQRVIISFGKSKTGARSIADMLPPLDAEPLNQQPLTSGNTALFAQVTMRIR